ncbi:phosphoglycerate kinase [Candidatus Saccharibacteria bacterium]|nr:phosphoglycerate kinase [Candidatus Saccharibacteria bacterium]
MFKKRTVRDIAVKNKVVLLRTDYNVPIQRGRITDDYRVTASLPTIEYLLEHGAKQVVIISHLGRPTGKERDFSLEPVAKRLEKLLRMPVYFQTSGKTIPSEPKIVMLENLRFDKGEEAGSASFAKKLIAQTKAELFVQDAFGLVHRAHASMVAITKLLPSVAGLLLEKEVDSVTKTMARPKRPLIAIIGGVKVEDKQPLIDLFAKTADTVALGGRLGINFNNTAGNVIVPLDYVYGKDGEPYDIGAISTATIVDLVKQAKTVIWNGVVGKVEEREFAEASKVIAEEIGLSDVTSLILGGDTSSFVLDLKTHDPELEYTLVSTGGGSALELILGKKLPGLDALPNKAK